MLPREVYCLTCHAVARVIDGVPVWPVRSKCPHVPVRAPITRGH